MDPPTKRNPAETKATYTAPPGSNLLLSGTLESRKLVMTSLVNQEAGTKHRKPAVTKQPPLAMAACRLERRPPPQRVHFSPRDARQRPMAASTQHSTMVVRAVCKYAGSESTEYLSVQLNIPVLYHVQSIHSPCICEIAVMMLEPTSALTFQLGSRVATMAPMMPSRARTNPNICMPVDAMVLFKVDDAAASALVLVWQHSPSASLARRPRCPAASLPSYSGEPAASQILSSSALQLQLHWAGGERQKWEIEVSVFPCTPSFLLPSVPTQAQTFSGWKQRTAWGMSDKSWLELIIGKQNTEGCCACVRFLCAALSSLLKRTTLSCYCRERMSLWYLQCSIAMWT